MIEAIFFFGVGLMLGGGYLAVSGYGRFLSYAPPPPNEAWVDMHKRLGERAAKKERLERIGYGSAIAGLLIVIGIFAFGAYIAGKGDADHAAQQWVDRWAPGAAFECQSRDTNDDGYVTCTVKQDDQLESIECGVDRWYHGWQTEGCRLRRLP